MRGQARMAGLAGAAVGLALIAGGCGGSSSKGKELKSIGKGEGALSLIAWAGYAEDGSNDPKVNWVGTFEKATGCKTTVKVAGTSDEMVTLMKTGQYDSVSASGNASQRLMASGDVAPINVSLLKNYSTVFAPLKDKADNSLDGKVYGVPHGWGANVLMWNKQKVTPAPTSWNVVWDPSKAAPYKGKVTMYDDWTTLADAAVYLRAHQPALKITNPYELDQAQFDAAVALAKQQKAWIGEYWSDYAKSQSSFAQGNSTVGSTWQVIANLLLADKTPTPISTELPSEGSTGWSDNWMISSKSKHPNCAYQWVDWITSPDVQAQVASYFGEAPANVAACTTSADAASECTTFHAKDEAYLKRIAFWSVPQTDCGDGRGTKCVPFTKWVQAWQDVKG